MIHGDKQMYQPRHESQHEEPIYSRGQGVYGRLPYGIRLQGEIREVMGTPPSARHVVRPDSRGRAWQERPSSRGGGVWQEQPDPRTTAWQEQADPRTTAWQDQQAARLAGQHHLASPPDLRHQRKVRRPQDEGDSDVQSSVDQFPSQATQGYND